MKYKKNNRWYDKKDGTRLTDCCGAYATHVDAQLCCKRCYKVVESGQGDGNRHYKMSPDNK